MLRVSLMKDHHQKITMAQVAEAAGVSKATVSRALGGSSLIGDDVRKHVEKAAADLGYVRRNQKRHAERSILTIKLVLPPAVNRAAQLFYSFRELIDGLSAGLAPSGTNIIVEVSGPDYQPFRHKKGGEVDAFVFAFHRPSSEVLAEIHERHVACVVLNRIVRGVRQVVNHHRDALHQIAGHLSSRRVKGDCCFVGYRGIEDVVRARLGGFTEGCEAYGIEFDPEGQTWIAESPQDITQEGVKEWYDKGMRTFVGVNDVTGALLIQHLKDLGLKIPQDVRVTGCDRGPSRSITIPKLTTVELSIYTLAEKAGQSLQAEIVEGKESAKAVFVKGHLLVGETT